MHLSLRQQATLPDLEELRKKILEQQQWNIWKEEALILATKAVLLLMKEKLRRREITPTTDNLSFLETKGVERNVFCFEYRGGFFTATIEVTPYTDLQSAEVEVSSVDHPIPSLHFHSGLVPGKRYMAENLHTEN